MDERVRLADLAALSRRLAGTRSRLERLRLVGAFLRDVPPHERAPTARLLAGRPFASGDARQLQVSGAGLARILARVVGHAISHHEAVDAADAVERTFVAARSGTDPRLTLDEAVQALEGVAARTGRGARAARDAILVPLFERASAAEAGFLTKVILGDMRQGAGEGLVLEAVARATGRSAESIRRAAMVVGDVGEAVRLAFELDEELPLQPRMFSPLKPMLAQTAPDLATTWRQTGGPAALEFKLDGARVQIHAEGGTVRLFSRRLHDVTASLPDIAGAVAGWIGGRRAILEGEAIALWPSGHPRPFQDLLQRYRRIRDVEEALRDVPVQLFLFDLLLDGQDVLLATPYAERWARLEALGPVPRVPRLVPASLEQAQVFYAQALHAGHEGLMIKRLDSPYTPGRRGGSWLKLKRVNTLDLVIVAADWGYGRRHGWLSNYHLAARDEPSGEYRPVGKTFKGLSDAEFEAITARLLAAQRRQEGGTVYVDPEIVVEVAYSDLQRSRLYPDGMALRFARITRIREDKAPAEVDTVQAMRRLFEPQGRMGRTP